MVAVSGQRKATLFPAVLVIGFIACFPISCFVSPLFSPRGRQLGVGRADGADQALTIRDQHIPWQHGLDRAVFDFEASIPEKIKGIRSVFDNRREVLKTFVEVALLIREKGPAAQTEVLDKLFPKGTYVRADIDSAITVAKSVHRQVPDVEPELEALRSDLQYLAKSLKPFVPKQLQEFSDDAAKRLLPIGVDKAGADAAERFRQVQSYEKEELSYVTVKETRDYQVRVYQPYALVKKATSEMKTAFSDLVEYLKDQERHATGMKAAMPVQIDYDAKASLHVAKAMSFPLQNTADITWAEPPKTEAGMVVKREPMQYVVTRNIIGASDAEVQVQLQQMYAALKRDGLYTPVAKDEYSVLQYYVPGAALWRRRTEVAFPVRSVN